MNTGKSTATMARAFASYANAPRYPKANKLSSGGRLSLVPINQNLKGFCRNLVAAIRDTRLLLILYIAADARRMDALIRLSSAIRSRINAAIPVENVVSDRLNTVRYQGTRTPGERNRSALLHRPKLQ